MVVVVEHRWKSSELGRDPFSGFEEAGLLIVGVELQDRETRQDLHSTDGGDLKLTAGTLLGFHGHKTSF